MLDQERTALFAEALAKVLPKLEPDFVKVLLPVLENVSQHCDYWLDMSDAYWGQRLTQEIGEMAGVLAGDHDDPLEDELTQIAAICLNWLRRLRKEKEDPLG